MPRERTTSAKTAAEIWTAEHLGRTVHGVGDREILKRKCIGLICSVQCPGSIVVKTFDAIRALRDAGIVVAGGFHSPMEKECLDFLLRGKQPVIMALAKAYIPRRHPTPWRDALSDGRLLIVSPFTRTSLRTTKATASARNEFVATISDVVLIPHASPGGGAEACARGIVQGDGQLLTFLDAENANLIELGASPFNLEAIRGAIVTASE